MDKSVEIKEVKTKKVRLCKQCKKPLRAIGDARVNGKPGLVDWESRLFHKKCHKEYLDDLKYYRMLKNMQSNK